MASASGNTPDFRLDGKCAVVTGGGSGIGQAIALRFAAQGAAVCILDISRDQAQQVAEQIIAAGGRSSAYACDVSDPARGQIPIR